MATADQTKIKPQGWRFYRRSCLGKIRHKNVYAAMVAIEKTRAPGARMNAYVCLFCRAYHIGRAKTKGEARGNGS